MPQKKEPIAIDTAIGRVSIAWSILEMTLGIILTELLEVEGITGLATSAALDYRHRRDLINSLAEIKLSGTETHADLRAYMGDVRGMNTERNLVVHSVWVRDERGRASRMTMRNRGRYESEVNRPSVRHLSTVSLKILDLSTRGDDLALRIRADVRAWRDKYPPLDGLRLVHEERAKTATHRKRASRPRSSPA